jgi:hypothetical protein
MACEFASVIDHDRVLHRETYYFALTEFHAAYVMCCLERLEISFPDRNPCSSEAVSHSFSTWHEKWWSMGGACESAKEMRSWIPFAKCKRR